MKRKIQDIEGIGSRYAHILGSVGITHTHQLLASGGRAEGRDELAERCGISSTLILKWVKMSDLFRIKGIAGQYAELLQAVGVDTVNELRHRNPENLEKTMREVNREKDLVLTTPGLNAIKSWIEQASKLEPAVHH